MGVAYFFLCSMSSSVRGRAWLPILLLPLLLYFPMGKSIYFTYSRGNGRNLRDPVFHRKKTYKFIHRELGKRVKKFLITVFSFYHYECYTVKVAGFSCRSLLGAKCQ